MNICLTKIQTAERRSRSREGKTSRDLDMGLTPGGIDLGEGVEDKPTDDYKNEDSETLNDEASVEDEEGDDPGELCPPHPVHWQQEEGKTGERRLPSIRLKAVVTRAVRETAMTAPGSKSWGGCEVSWG